jgi:hypothetical protein
VQRPETERDCDGEEHHPEQRRAHGNEEQRDNGDRPARQREPASTE